MHDPRAALALGNVALYGVPFPVAIGDRYIHLRVDAGDPICQIWRWDATAGVAIREPDPGEAGGSGIRLEPYGAAGLSLDFAAGSTGPGLTGRLDSGNVRILCTDEAIEVWRGDMLNVRIGGGSLRGMEVGVRVTDEGTSLGGSLPEGFAYRLDYANRRIVLGSLITDPRAPLLHHLRFVHCQIEGPAVVCPVGTVTVNGGTWDMLGAPEAARDFKLPVADWAYGAILAKDLTFDDCDFINVALAFRPS